MRHFTWLFCLIFAVSNVSASSRTRVFSKTRWHPSAGTLHSAVLWHEMVDSKKTLPIAKKIFNFARQDQVKALEDVSSSFSRKVLGKTMDIELREVAAYFSEKIIKFAQQKRRDHTTFACIFKTSDVQKTTVVEIQLTRSKSKKIAGEMVMFGRCKEPCPEIANLLLAAVLDDSSLKNYFTKGLWCMGALFAWFKFNDFLSLTFLEDLVSLLRAEKNKKQPKKTKALRKQSDGSTLLDDDSSGADEGCVGSDEKKRVGADRRALITPEKTDDSMAFINAESLYQEVVELVIPVFENASEELLRDAVEIDGGIDFLPVKEKTRLLDDGSIDLVCGTGRARIVVHKNGQEFALDRLLQERENEDDLLIILHCEDLGKGPQSDLEGYQISDLPDCLYGFFEKKFDGQGIILCCLQRMQIFQEDPLGGGIEIWRYWGMCDKGMMLFFEGPVELMDGDSEGQVLSHMVMHHFYEIINKEKKLRIARAKKIK